MASGSLWDQLAQRKRRTLEARARRGEPLVQDKVTEVVAQASTNDVVFPVHHNTLVLGGVSLPLRDRNIIAVTVQFSHEQRVYPVKVHQQCVPENMSAEQLFEWGTSACEPVTIIDTRIRLWHGYEGRSRDMHVMRNNEDYMQRIYAVQLACEHSDNLWLEISTEFPLQWRDTASWLLTFEQLLDNACFTTIQ